MKIEWEIYAYKASLGRFTVIVAKPDYSYKWQWVVRNEHGQEALIEKPFRYLNGSEETEEKAKSAAIDALYIAVEKCRR